MTHSSAETPTPRSESRLGFVAAILLGVAATLTALSSYQAALKDGEALEGYSTSNLALSDANYYFDQATQERSGDLSIFVAFVQARLQDQSALEGNLRNLMTPNLSEAIDWWDETDAAITPFDDLEGNPYTLEALPLAQEQTDMAERAYSDAAEADAVGDVFELATVFLAMTLFFGGIATLFRRKALSVTLMVFAVIALGIGSATLLTAFAV